MWYIEEMCQHSVYKREARCTSLSRSLVKGDMEIIGLNSTRKGHQTVSEPSLGRYGTVGNAQLSEAGVGGGSWGLCPDACT